MCWSQLSCTFNTGVEINKIKQAQVSLEQQLISARKEQLSTLLNNQVTYISLHTSGGSINFIDKGTL